MVQLLGWTDITRGRFYEWKKRYGKANEHNGKIPRDHWIEPWEGQAIISYHAKFPLEGYRRLTFMMLDDPTCRVAVSPSTTYRVLRKAGLLDKFRPKSPRKGRGFAQPQMPHEHWHVDISYINVAATFYYLCSVLDGYSRTIVHHDLRKSMTEADVEMTLQRAHEKYPHTNPRVISDNGPQFIANDFKVFIREVGMTHVRTSPYYPQSNGKIERWHKSLKAEAIRFKCPTTPEETKVYIDAYVEHYNNFRLHSAIGYITPADKLAGREKEIWMNRDRKLEVARERRRLNRQSARAQAQIPVIHVNA